MGWMSYTDSNYQYALEKSQSFGPKGFVKPEQAGSGRDQLLTCISQHNSILQLLVDLHKKIDSIEAELKILRKEKGSSSSSDLSEVISKLETLSLGPKEVVPEKKGKFYAFKDPYAILEEVKQKLKK